MHVEDPDDDASYLIDSEVGAAEWARLVPPRPEDLLVYVKDDTSDPNNASDVRMYSVTLFHQLKCLDVIRRQFMLPQLPSTSVEGENRTPPVRPVAQHCVNYLRQTIWCRPSLWMASVISPQGGVSRSYDVVCRDWEEVYAAAARNRASFDDH